MPDLFSYFFYSIQQTTDSGYIVAGSTEDFGAGFYSDDAWVLKLDSGNIQWQKVYEGKKEDWFSSVQQMSDGSYIAAGSTNFLISMLIIINGLAG